MRDSSQQDVALDQSMLGASGEIPRLRGVVHGFAFFLALGAGIVVVALADESRAHVASGLYAATLAAMFGASALYHRIRWASESVRERIRRLDRSAIFVFIAGTYTPFALLALQGRLGLALLVVVWTGALVGLLLNLAWLGAPTWLATLPYVGLGWVGVVALPNLFSSLGLAVSVLVLVGGVLYTLGALVFVLRRPDPSPAVFGFHEVFHVFVMAAAAVHYIAVCFVVAGA